jgi:hypothetical protein
MRFHPSCPISRRAMLQRLGTGLGVLGLAGILHEDRLRAVTPKTANSLAPRAPHFPPRAKRVIHLFMNGGPSHVDTFDPKQALGKHHGEKPPASITIERNSTVLMRSPFAFHKSGQSGIEVSELFPRVAEHIDDICVIRSMHTDTPNHEPSLFLMACGDTQPVRPAMGSWLLYGLGSENQNLPGFVAMSPGKVPLGPQLISNSFLPGIFQGMHVNNARLDPRSVLAHIDNTYLAPESQREQLDLLNELNRRHLEQRGGQDNPLEARIASLEMAFCMQTEAQEVFDLSRETQRTRELYGSGPFADACLTARRLAERGVRMVQIFTGNGQSWDDHKDILAHRDKARQTDQPIAALLADLKARGLLDDTLVLWGGEFGRTPTSERSRGRDHNNRGFTVWLAGGGVKGGMAYGATDEIGYAAVENKMHVHDLHATILHLMGIDHEKLTYRYSGRDFRLTDVAGTVARAIIA